MQKEEERGTGSLFSLYLIFKIFVSENETTLHLQTFKDGSQNTKPALLIKQTEVISNRIHQLRR